MMCQRCLVSGHVQGVWFRASTQQQARALGLVGRAANLPDGRVEVIVCGQADVLRQFHDWLWQGPELARVMDVACETIAMQDFSDFTTG